VGRRGPSREARSRRSPGRGRTPRGGVGRRRGAGAEVREDLVDHGPLRDERDDPHGPATGRAGQRVDLEDLLQERRPSAAGLGRRQPWRGDDGGRHGRCRGRRRASRSPSRDCGIRIQVRTRLSMHQPPQVTQPTASPNTPEKRFPFAEPAPAVGTVAVAAAVLTAVKTRSRGRTRPMRG